MNTHRNAESGIQKGVEGALRRGRRGERKGAKKSDRVDGLDAAVSTTSRGPALVQPRAPCRTRVGRIRKGSPAV